MPIGPEQKAICEIARILRDDGENWFRKQGEIGRPMNAAKQRFKFLSVRDVEQRLLYGAARGQFEAGQLVMIAPPAKEVDAVAAFSCRWDFVGDEPSCGFYFGIWNMVPAFPTGQDNADKVVGFVGYRFETPEEGDNHNYFHAQPCAGMGLQEDDVTHALPISSRMPTFPVAASSSVELLLCMVIAIYGMQGLLALEEKLLQVSSARNNEVLLKALKSVAGVAVARPGAAAPAPAQ